MKTLFVTLGLLAVLGLTHGQDCYSDEWECDNGNCIWADFICDGYDDCGDGSDEGGDTGICPECPSDFWKCDNGRCIWEDFTCDTDNDCGDWSDESETICACADDEIRCSARPGDEIPGACIPPEYICDADGIWDCPNGDDEQNCTTRTHNLPKSSIKKVRPTLLKKPVKKLKKMNKVQKWYKFHGKHPHAQRKH